MTTSSEIIKFATYRKNPFTKKNLLEYLKADTEDISAGTIHVLLNRLVESEKNTGHCRVSALERKLLL